MNYSLVIEPFNVWVFDYMRHFPSSNGYTHILVDVDYITKWVEAIPTSSADHNTSIKMLKQVIFPRFGVPRYSMTDGGSQFIHGAFRKMLAKYIPPSFTYQQKKKFFYDLRHYFWDDHIFIKKG